MCVGHSVDGGDGAGLDVLAIVDAWRVRVAAQVSVAAAAAAGVAGSPGCGGAGAGAAVATVVT